MNFKRLLLGYLILSHLIIGPVIANDLSDSLQAILRKPDVSDSLRAAVLINLALDESDREKSLAFGLQAFRLAKNTNIDFLKANGHFTVGRLLAFFENNTDSAAYHFDIALEYFDPQKDQIYIADIKRRKGHFFSYQDNHAEAVKNYLAALEVFEQEGEETKMADTYNDIANSNNYLGAHEKALKDYQKALSIYAANGDDRGEAMVMSNMAIIYCEEEEYENCENTLRKVIGIYRNLNNKSLLASTYTSLGSLFTETQRMDSALYYLIAAEELLYEVNDIKELAFTKQFKGKYFKAIGDYDKAIQSHNEALKFADKLNNIQLALNNNEFLSQVYELKGDFKKALEYYKIEDELSDSIFTLSSDRQFKEIQAKYENARQQAENQELKNEAELREAQLQKQKLYTTFLAIIIFIVLISAVILYNAYKKILSQKQQAELDREIIKEQAAKLEKNDQLKSKFFGNISHELRTPLTILLGMIDSLAKDKKSNLSPEEYEKLAMAKSHGQKIQQLIEEVFELTKMEVNKISIDPKPTQILPVLERIVFSFHSLAEEKNIDLNISYGQIHNVHINLDIPKFEKIINNLIINAIKFTPENGVVTVKINYKQDHDFIIIEVQDSGIGIPEDELNYIFDRFYQVSSEASAANPGTGLGLAMAKELTELHGGTISAHSIVNEGSTFSISLPVTDNLSTTKEKDPEKNIELILESLLDDMKSSDLNKILIVEDNPDMRDYLNIVFKDHFDLEFAQNGIEALDILKNTRVSLIISDLMMPKMDGVALLENVKANPDLKNIPVIILTAKVGEQDKLNALRMGVDDYITKPFSAEEIKVRVQVLIKNFLSRKDWHQKVEDNDEKGPIGDGLIIQIRDYIKSNIGNYNINIAQIADHLAMSERQLYRKIGTATGLTPNQLIREIKLQYAMELLQNKAVSKVSVLAKEVGFESSGYFARLFYERFGKKPQAFLQSA